MHVAGDQNPTGRAMQLQLLPAVELMWTLINILHSKSNLPQETMDIETTAITPRNATHSFLLGGNLTSNNTFY